MRGVRSVSFPALALVLGLASPGGATVSGGGSKKADCYVEFTGISPTGKFMGKQQVDCTDGDPTCDGDGSQNNSCTFTFQVCEFNTDPSLTKCTPQPVTMFSKNSRSLVLPATGATAMTCAANSQVVVAVKVPKNPKKKAKPGRLKVTLVAVSSGKPKRDNNVFYLRCLPGSGQTTQSCAPNSTGPSQVTFAIRASSGADLDTGWTGTSHNFPVPANSSLTYCLSNCGATGACTATASTGPGTVNGPDFGPPLPLLAAGAPVCVVNRYADKTVTGVTANYKTGELTGPLNLLSDVYITTLGNVCPSCEGGTCDSGVSKGASCTDDADLRVADTGRTYHLSKKCLPDGTPATLTVNLPLTTGESDLTSAQCQSLPALCNAVKSDSCNGSGCGTVCTGAACVSMIQDPDKPTDPTAKVCVDRKGGISQNCCNGDTTQPCFTVANGGTLVRKGLAVAPAGSPLTANEVLAGTFCIPVIPPPNCNTSNIAGLPGPGAIEWPVTTTWK